MKRTLLKKTIISVILVALLSFSVISVNLLFVRADPIGVGKFVSVNFDPENENPGTVTLLKLSSSETWLFPLSPDTGDNNVDFDNNRVKVGAGDVQLIAQANPGYEFVCWKDGNDVITVDGPQNVYEFKTSKGTTSITAVFQSVTYKIEYFVSAGEGNISLTNDPEEAIIPVPNPDYPGEVEVSLGGSQGFWFYPNENNFVSAILVDGAYVAPLDSGFGLWYEFTDVHSDHTIGVTFSVVGGAITIPTGIVTLFVGEGASLTFGGSTGGIATATLITDFPEGGTAYLIWDIQNTATDDDGSVTITFKSTYPLTEVIAASSLEATFCDVNHDGIIDASDVSAVAIAIRSADNYPHEYDPLYDVNNDGMLTNLDVTTVNSRTGETVLYLEPTLIFASEGLYYYEVETGHFSIFRGR